MAKEAQARTEEDELNKLRSKYDSLMLRSNGQLMKIMTLEARLSFEVKKTVDLEVALQEAERDFKELQKMYQELEAKCVGCSHETQTGMPCYQHGEVAPVGPFSIEVKLP